MLDWLVLFSPRLIVHIACLHRRSSKTGIRGRGRASATSFVNERPVEHGADPQGLRNLVEEDTDSEGELEHKPVHQSRQKHESHSVTGITLAALAPITPATDAFVTTVLPIAVNGHVATIYACSIPGVIRRAAADVALRPNVN
jgi:hypothetical protein